MNQTEQLEIDRIVSEIADGGVSSERMARLDALLRHRPDLQEHYACAMTLHMLLNFEFDLSMQRLQPVIANCDSPSPNIVPRPDPCGSPSKRIQHDANKKRFIVVYGHLLTAIASAAAVAAVFITYSVWHPLAPIHGYGRFADAPYQNANSDLSGSDSPIVGPPTGFMVRDAHSLRQISRLTKTNSLASVLLPQQLNDDMPGISLCNGIAWMEHSSSERERGYLLALPPGFQLDVSVYTDASDENALSVVELDDRGRMTGSSLAFSNDEQNAQGPSSRRQGCIGNFTEFNDHEKPMYYLLTGSHRTPRQEAEDHLWRLSDFSMPYRSADVLVIGWDDSCFVEKEGDPRPDKDYNDIQALIRLSRRGETKPERTTVRYSPEIERDMPLAPTSKSGFSLEVKPGELLALLATSSARYQNVLRIVDAASRQILWQEDGTDLDGDGFSDLGRTVFLIRNDSPAVREYEIQVQTKDGATSGQPTWRDCPFQTSPDGDRAITIGFEDDLNTSDYVDWNDIRIYARWLSE
ncbi:MAG: hypothetical protein IT425_14275 [Pirellulales bacterium]|nr:hypothetical protein [Pirellulales bacterium]